MKAAIRVGAALMLLGASVIAVLLLRDRNAPVVQQPSLPSAQAPQTAEVALPAETTAVVSVPAPCEGQLVEVTSNGKTHSACFSETRTLQNGGVRVYRVEAVSGRGYSLRIEAAGSRVLSAALGVEGAQVFRCDGKACGAAIAISKHDIDGVRVISLNQAHLTSTADAQVVVTGKLKTQPEDQVPGLACTGQGVSIVTSDSSSMMFCPKAGAGFEIGDDGRRTYRFTNLDGASLLVTVDQDHRAQRVAYQGDATLACASPPCGVQISAAGSSGTRTFSFGGTTLIEVSTGQSSAVLNGTLIVPPL